MLLQATLGVAQSFFGIIGQFVIVLVLSIYWSIDRVRFERLWLSVLPAGKRSQAREIWREIETSVGAYIRSEFIQVLLAGILLGLGYWLMGLRYPVLLALSGALLWLIPWMGAVLAVGLPLVVGLSGGLGLAALAVLYTLVVLLLLEVVVEPRLFNRRRYSSLLIVLFVVAMADVYGLIGLIIAPPLAAATQTLFYNLMRAASPAQTVDARVQVENLRKRLTALRETVVISEENSPPELYSLIERVEQLIDETETHIREEGADQPTLGLPLSPETSRQA
jgi:predicted PurR-regulated permease PerM